MIVLSLDPEMMVVSLKSTANTVLRCPFRLILSVVSVGDLILHTDVPGKEGRRMYGNETRGVLENEARRSTWE